MFDQLTHQQHLADFLKAVLMQYSRTPDHRSVTKPILGLIKRFEGSRWYPQAFEQALADIAPSWITVQNVTEFRYEPRPDAAAITVQLLSRYLELIGEQDERETV